MKSTKPTRRTEAQSPEETRHLKPGQIDALELGGEAEHATGPRRETLIRKASKAAGEGQKSAQPKDPR
jgi:hypothetical protein